MFHFSKIWCMLHLFNIQLESLWVSLLFFQVVKCDLINSLHHILWQTKAEIMKIFLMKIVIYISHFDLSALSETTIFEVSEISQQSFQGISGVVTVE